MIVKSGDTTPMQWRTNADLAGATVRFIAKQRGGLPVVLPATVDSGDTHLAVHMLDGTLPPGDYQLVLKVTRGVGVVTFPSEGYEALRVEANLDRQNQET